MNQRNFVPPSALPANQIPVIFSAPQTHNRQRRFTGALPPPMGHAVVVDPSQQVEHNFYPPPYYAPTQVLVDPSLVALATTTFLGNEHRDLRHAFHHGYLQPVHVFSSESTPVTRRRTRPSRHQFPRETPRGVVLPGPHVRHTNEALRTTFIEAPGQTTNGLLRGVSVPGNQFLSPRVDICGTFSGDRTTTNEPAPRIFPQGEQVHISSEYSPMMFLGGHAETTRAPQIMMGQPQMMFPQGAQIGVPIEYSPAMILDSNSNATRVQHVRTDPSRAMFPQGAQIGVPSEYNTPMILEGNSNTIVGPKVGIDPARWMFPRGDQFGVRDEYSPTMIIDNNFNITGLPQIGIDPARGMFPQGTQIGISNEYNPTMIFEGHMDGTEAQQIIFNSAQGMLPRGAQASMPSEYGSAITLDSDTNNVGAQQVRLIDPPQRMCQQSSQVSIPTTYNPTAILDGYVGPVSEGDVIVDMIQEGNTWHASTLKERVPLQKPAGKKVKKRKRQRNQHQKETVTQPTVTQPMVTQQMVTQPGIVSEPVISTFNPDYFLNSVAQCQQGSLEGRSTRLQEKNAVNSGEESGQAESIVTDILDSFSVEIPELYKTLVEENAAPLKAEEEPAVRQTENLHRILNLMSAKKQETNTGPILELITSPPRSPSSADPDPFSYVPWETIDAIKIVSGPPHNMRRVETHNSGDVIQFISSLPSSEEDQRKPQNPDPLSDAPGVTDDIIELLASLPDSTLCNEDAEIQTSGALYDDLWTTDDFNALISSLPDNILSEDEEIPNPDLLSGALWDTEDVIQLMSSLPEEDQEETADPVALSAGPQNKDDVILLVDFSPPNNTSPSSSSYDQNEKTALQNPDPSSDALPQEVSTVAKYQQCCCRGECASKHSGNSAEIPLSTCELVTMPWTEYFALFDEMTKKKNPKKRGVSTKRKRKRSESDEEEESAKSSGKRVRWSSLLVK